MNVHEELHSGPSQGNDPSHQIQRHNKRGVVGGFVLVALGVLFLADNLLPDFRFGDYWPLILVAIGIGILWNANRRS
jgi:hypothetical protein